MILFHGRGKRPPSKKEKENKKMFPLCFARSAYRGILKGRAEPVLVNGILMSALWFPAQPWRSRLSCFLQCNFMHMKIGVNSRRLESHAEEKEERRGGRVGRGGEVL